MYKKKVADVASFLSVGFSIGVEDSSWISIYDFKDLSLGISKVLATVLYSKYTNYRSRYFTMHKRALHASNK